MTAILDTAWMQTCAVASRSGEHCLGNALLPSGYRELADLILARLHGKIDNHISFLVLQFCSDHTELGAYQKDSTI